MPRHRSASPFDELARIALNGFESAFAPWQERRRHARCAASSRDLPALLTARVSAGAEMVAARSRDGARETRRRHHDGAHPRIGARRARGSYRERRSRSRSARSRASRHRASPGTPVASSPAQLAARRVIVARRPLPSVRRTFGRDSSRFRRACSTRAVRARCFVSNAAGGINRTFRAGRPHDHRGSPQPDVAHASRRPSRARATRASPTCPRRTMRCSFGELRDAALEAGVSVAERCLRRAARPRVRDACRDAHARRARGRRRRDVDGAGGARRRARLGMRVAGVSCITNLAAGLSTVPLGHAEVLETTARVAERFERLVTAFVVRIAQR